MNDEARRKEKSEEAESRAERETLVASYALGGVAAADAAAARQLIASDPDAARLYEEFAAIAAVLPEIYAEMETTPAQPSAALKARVLSDVRVALADRTARDQPDRAAQERPLRPIPAIRDRRRAPFSSGWLVAAVLLLVVMGLGVWNISLHRDVAQANRDRDIIRFAASGVHAYTMAGTQNAPSANATLIESSADGGKVLFLAKGFPGAAAGQTYRVWLQKQDGSYVDAGTFGGGGETTLVLPGNLNGIHAVVITAEPQTKPAAGPTGPPVMEGALT